MSGKSRRELLVESQFAIISATGKLSSNVQTILYGDNIELRKQQINNVKENMKEIVKNLYLMSESLNIDINDVLRRNDK